jgi:hypothetical protein
MKLQRIGRTAALMAALVGDSTCAGARDQKLELSGYSVERPPCGPSDRRGKVWYEIRVEDRLSTTPLGLPAAIPKRGRVRHQMVNCTENEILVRTCGAKGALMKCDSSTTSMELDDDSHARLAPLVGGPFARSLRATSYESIQPAGIMVLGWDDPCSQFETLKGHKYMVRAVFTDAIGGEPSFSTDAKMKVIRGPLRSNTLALVCDRDSERGIP